MASKTFRSLQERNARIFFFGLLVSNVGSWMQLTAMSALVYSITGKVSASSSQLRALFSGEM